MLHNSVPNFVWNTLRNLFSSLDLIGYSLLDLVYKIFYSVASAEIISGEVVKVFYSRIQLILGIIMIFKLSLSVLTIIINPDSLQDKNNGAAKVVTRVVVSLFMLTLVIPINTPKNTEKDSLYYFINDHGILFGFLYKFQDSVMRENIIGKLVLGSTTSPTATELDENGYEVNNFGDVGGTMSAAVAQAFIRPNTADESKPYCLSDGDEGYKEDDPCPNVRCPHEVYKSGYTDPDLSATDLLSQINVKCESQAEEDGGEERYAFTYLPIVGLITSGIMIFIIIGFTVDIAVRSIKLAILRLVAPIPIISYIDPKSQKDGAFGNWTKTLISTYIDLFVRLAIVYFGAFLIIMITNGGVSIFGRSDSTAVNLLAMVFIIIGILAFMKQAPKFIRDMLGLKGSPMGNVGLSGLLGGAAMALGGGGAAGFALGAMQGATGAMDAAGQGKAASLGQAWSSNRDQMRKIVTGDKDARGGFIGRAMDRALYRTRENQLAMKGLSAENKEAAKAAFYDQQDVVKRAKTNRDLAFEKVTAMGISSDPSSEPIPEAPNFANYNNDFNAYQQAQNTYQDQVRQRAARQAAWDDFVKKEKFLNNEEGELGKIEGNYKNISSARERMGTDPRLIDEYTYVAKGSRPGRAYREGGNRDLFNPYAKGNPADKLDDMGVVGSMPEIGGGPQ